MIRIFLTRLLLALLVLAATLYGCDFVSVRVRMRAGKPGDPIDVLTFPHVLAIPQKGRRIEYTLDVVTPMITQQCVHSLFPQLGYEPCWYVKRENQSPVPMVIMPLLGPRH